MLCALRGVTLFTVMRLLHKFWSSLNTGGVVALAWRSRCHSATAEKHCTSHWGVESPPLPLNPPPLKNPRISEHFSWESRNKKLFCANFVLQSCYPRLFDSGDTATEVQTGRLGERQSQVETWSACYRSPKPKWLGEGAKALLTSWGDGLPRVSCTNATLFRTSATLSCTSAAGRFHQVWGRKHASVGVLAPEQNT